MTMHRYQPRSPLQAIDPKAFFGLFAPYEEKENTPRDDATIVTVRGPISQHNDYWEDSYEAIRERVKDACTQAAPVVLLRIDSPGGDIGGLFDTARSIRSMCDAAGKRLLVHVEGQCCSAGYALAVAADRIVASRTAEVGSIGVIATRVDQTKAMENAGIKISLISSGARKADGCPCQPMSKDEQAEFQDDIDGLAQEFFSVVSLRRGISIDRVAALEAATFRGDAALKAGLVDELGSFDHTIASLGAPTAGDVMSEKEDEARSALNSLAEDEDQSDEDREKARRALAALDGEEEEEAEGEEEEEEAEEEEDDESAEDDDEESKKASKSPGTVSAKTAGEFAAYGSVLEKRLAKVEKRQASSERKRMVAAHGGVSKEMALILASKPLGEVKALLGAIPKPKVPKLGDHAVTTTVPATRGAGTGTESRLPPKESSAMRRAMGLEKEKYGVVKRGNVQILGASLDDGGES